MNSGQVESFEARFQRPLRVHEAKRRDEYQHEPLPSESAIRLLQIENDPHLSLRLDSFPLNELPLYAALSYTWGKAICEDDTLADQVGVPGTIHTILVNNKFFNVTENLFNALVQLQTENIGWLWVDAIAIDQKNLKERSSQVRLIGQIYKKANRVVIWLGNDTEDVDAILWSQDVLYPVWKEVKSDNSVFNEQIIQALGITTEIWIENWKKVDRFFRRRRWYQRAWVVQEALLAKSIELRNGQTLLDWEKLVYVIVSAIGSGCPIPSAGQFILIAAFIPTNKDQELIDQREMSEKYAIRTKPQQLLCFLFTLVHSIRSFSVACEHDKIYAAIGIAQSRGAPNITDFITPNYASSWENVFIEFTTLMLENLPTLLSLSRVEGPQRSPSLPSWCPDYRVPPLFPLIDSGSGNPYSQLFSASGPVGTGKAINYLKGEILSVNGRRVDIISKNTERLDVIVNSDLSETIEPCFNICSELPLIYTLTGQDRLEVLWRTMMLDQYYHMPHRQYHPAPPQVSVGFFAWVKAALAVELNLVAGTEAESAKRLELVDRIKRWHQQFGINLTPEDIFTLAYDILKVRPRSQLHITTANLATKFLTGYGVSRWANGRCLFLTSLYQMFGLGPEKIEKDDEIWLIKETYVPFVLRPRLDGRYHLVGEAYVHGIMHGEWLSRNKDALFQPIEIM